MLGKRFLQAMNRSPRMARLAMRTYLRSGLPVPKRADWIVHQLVEDLAPKAPTLSVWLEPGLRLDIDPSTIVGKLIYFYGSCEPEVAACLSKLLRPGMTVIDAGANVGELALRCARIVGSQGCVYAIEASPQTASTLRQNIAANQLTNIEVIEAALAEAAQPLTFHFGTESDSHSSSLYEPSDRSGNFTTVQGISLDELIEDKAIPRVDLLKMDVEGAELRAFAGGKTLLSRATRPTILFEYNKIVADRAGWTLRDAFDALMPYGYHLAVIGPRGNWNTVAKAEEVPLEGPFPKLDLLALPT